MNSHLIDPKTMTRVEVSPEAKERILHRLRLAEKDSGVYARWYHQDLIELLTLLRALEPPSPPEDSPASSTRPEGA